MPKRPRPAPAPASTRGGPDALAVEWRPLAQVTPATDNPRTIPPEAVDAVAESVRAFGWRQPLVVDRDGIIIAGHTRLLAAAKLGLATVPVVVARDLSADEARALRVADNRAGDLSAWDPAKLRSVLDDIPANLDLNLDPFDFDGLLASLEAPVDPINPEKGEGLTRGDADAAPDLRPNAPPVSERGEVYELGPHRLMCGDSTSAEDWRAVLGGEIGDAVMTDPPYGVNYVGKTKDALSVENDDPEGLPLLLDGALGHMFDRCKPGGAWYVAAPARPLSLIFESWLHGRGILRQCIIWVKDSMVLGHSDYHYKHEPIYYGWKPGAPHRAPPDRTQVSVWEIARPKRSAEHPTMKPVELYERMMNNSTAPGEIVLEPFGGSGTTLIAAARTGRACRAMEIAPRYCDVIRRRWTAFAKANGVEPGTGALD